MYATTNFKSKKALKEAVASGKEVGIYQPNEIIPNPKAAPNYSGPAALEGPWYPALIPGTLPLKSKMVS